MLSIWAWTPLLPALGRPGIYGAIEALLRLIEALLRRYSGSILLGRYKGAMPVLGCPGI